MHATNRRSVSGLNFLKYSLGAGVIAFGTIAISFAQTDPVRAAGSPERAVPCPA